MNEPNTPEQVSKLSELDMLLRSQGVELPYVDIPDLSGELRTVVLKKFLIARQWNVTNALDMITSTVEFRRAQGWTNRSLFPPPKDSIRGFDVEDIVNVFKRPPRTLDRCDVNAAVMRTAYTGVWHKWDKQNRPLFIERTGRIDVRRMVDILRSLVRPGEDFRQPALDAHLFANEVGVAMVQYQMQKHRDPTLTQVTVIMDCDGVSLSHMYKPALDVLELMSKTDQLYYPEGLHRLFVVNCPTVVTMAYNVCRPWLDVRVQQKIFFCKSHQTRDLLREYIDDECLPCFLGGTCTCEGECVPLPTSDLPAEFKSSCATERIAVGAGSRSSRVVPMKKFDAVEWQFVTEEYNIQFSAVFGGVTVVAPSRVECNEVAVVGQFVAPDNGQLLLHFDNTYSWIHSKTVVLLLTSTPHT